MDLDYQKLGFKAGIEIHQELNTKKLFCNCNSSLKEEKLVSEISRKLRATAGESGKIDLAAVYEQLRAREFIYHGYENEVCLVDLDEEPPLLLDDEAFMIALGVAKMFKLKVPEGICVMRKTVSDGSAVSGFQRTMLIGIESKDSFLETPKGKVKINQLNLEEDSCKIEKKEENKVYYSISRLGIPLLEVGTDATLKDPEHVKEAALEIGTLLRSFNVKRGLGTIRQDVNISIKGGTRIEVKGWQDLKKLEELVKNEVIRQCSLLAMKKELESRGLKSFDKKAKDVTNLFEKTESKIIYDLIKNKGKVLAIILPKFSSLLKKDICPGKTFGKELSEYAKAYGTKGIIHTDEDLKKYKLEKEFGELCKLFKAKKEDLIIIVAEKPEIAEKAINAVYERALFCLNGVPEETRVPNHSDATSSYARPLPGAHRMYPETDVPNILVTKKILDSIILPELLSDKIKKLSNKYKISETLSKELLEFDGFGNYVNKYKNIDPKFIAQTFIESPKEIKKRYNLDINIKDNINDIFNQLNQNHIGKDAVFEILVEIAQGKKIDFSKYTSIDNFKLEKEIKKIIEDNKNLPTNALIGKVMKKLRGKAEGGKIVELVKKLN